jgi:hypothetical protein
MHYPRPVRTRHVVLFAVLLVLLLAATGLALGVVFAHGVWQNLWLNLLTEAAGTAFIVLFVDRLFERSERRERDDRRRAASEDLRVVLRALRSWLVALFLESEAGAKNHLRADDPDSVPVEPLLEGLPAYLGTINFAAPGPYKRDRYLVEWAKRSFDQTAMELARWERNFAGSAGLFDEGFREGAETLRSFVLGIGSFLEGMERYIVRERPTSPVFAYDGVTELTEANAARLVSQLRDFLGFYRDESERYGAVVADADAAGQAATASANGRAASRP